MTTSQVIEQMPLRVQLRDDATFDNYYAQSSIEAVEHLKLMARGQGEQCVYISGAEGVGCSHLLQAACHEAQNKGFNSVYLPLDELVLYSPAVFESLEDLPLIALDNVQCIAGQAAWEQALFHLYNRVRDAGGRLVLAADVSLGELGVQLVDLESRLKWGLLYHIETPDEAFKVAALQYRAQKRGLELNVDVSKYIVKQVAANMEAMFKVLQQLDSASLSAQRKLTRPFVKTVMKW